MGILTVGGLEPTKRAAGIARILVLDTGLVHDNGISRGIKCLAVEQGIEG
jgi:hypothetical protein